MFFCVSIILLIFLILITHIVFFLKKKNFLKLYYFHFIRFKNLRKFFFLLKKTENIIKNFLGSSYGYFVFIRYNTLKFYMVFSIFKDIIFLYGDISCTMKMVPLYGLYYFVINIYNFILTKFQEDFDISIAEFYYESLNFNMERNELKTAEYVKFLLFDVTYFVFKDSIYIILDFHLESNWLTINTNKYSINKSPLDFFSRIQKLKPVIKNAL